jgi:DNA primase catalytic core
MARIKNDDIERLKDDVPLQRLVESYGVKLKKKGKDLIGLCPFHDDKEPSLVISPDKNLWHCMGACQEGGSVIDWIMKTEGVSFRHAVEILKERWSPYGGKESGKESPSIDPRPLKPVKHSTARKLDSEFFHKSDKQDLLNQYIDYCHRTLKDNPEGLSYLENRNLKNPEMIGQFKLGLSNRTLCYHLPVRARAAGAEIRGKFQELGVLRDSGHEHFWGSLMIPIFDENGNVVEIYGRRIGPKLREGRVAHLYLPGPHRGVWNFSSLAASQEIILCEALIDALTFWCYGFRNVTSSYGINGFTNEHMEAFKRFGIQRVLIAYDRDDAGDKAAEKLSKKLMAQGIECFRIKFPMGMDANAYACEIKSVEKAFARLIKNAEWIGKGAVIGGQGSVVSEKKETVSDPPAANHQSPTTNFPSLAAAADSDVEPAVSVFPPAPTCEIPVEIKEEEIIMFQGERRWRIRGLSKNMSYDLLKVNLLVSQKESFHVDTLDLYCARHRTTFIKQAAVELGLHEETIKRDMGRVLLKLEELQDEQIKRALEPKKKEKVLSEEEQKEALELLKAPDLLNRILEDFKRCEVVGEETNKLVGYLAAVSRKLEVPLAVLIQSSTAAGKTWLMDSILSFIPGEERVKYSAMTGQSLFYMGERDLKYKILAIMEEEGAERASYALKLLQSEGELSIASTGKDPSTGKLVTHEYRVEGPVMIFSTTTSIDIDEELQNRCIVLTVNESREQTRAIHKLQRERRTLKGLIARREKPNILKRHRNAQRLLRPLSVVNPYAAKLTFLDDKTRTRRDHEKYLSLIESITLLHQYQRPFKSNEIGGKAEKHLLVTLGDIEIANRLANEVLGRSLDELPPQTRKLLMIIEEMVDKVCKQLKIKRSEYRFSRRRIREYCGWGNTQLKLHLKRLEEMEYLIVHRGCRGQSYEYELLYDGNGKDGSTFLMGLIDVKRLRKKGDYEEKKSGVNGKLSGLEEKKSVPGRPLVGGWSGGGRVGQKALDNSDLSPLAAKMGKNTHIGLKENETSTIRLEA